MGIVFLSFSDCFFKLSFVRLGPSSRPNTIRTLNRLAIYFLHSCVHIYIYTVIRIETLVPLVPPSIDEVRVQEW